MSEERLCQDIENKQSIPPAQSDNHEYPALPYGGEDRRRQAMARYLAGDRIEDICRELGCTKSWLYKWRTRYRANDSTWVRERTRRPSRNPRQTPDHIAAAIVHLDQVLGPQDSGRARADTIWKALQEQSMEPLPSRRTIYRILQRYTKEAHHPTSSA